MCKLLFNKPEIFGLINKSVEEVYVGLILIWK